MSDRLASLEPYRLSPPRQRVQDLHGPMDAHGSRWLDPTAATERWAHGQLTHVVSATRHSELQDLWGAERVRDATVGPLDVPPLTPEDRAACHTPTPHRWPGMLPRAFEHAGCKAAHVAALHPDGLRPFGAIGEALLDARSRPRAAVLQRLVEGYRGDTSRLYAELDAVDRALDAAHQERPWIFDAVPDHCLRLWPLRNIMRLAERRGVLFRPMSFTAYEAENSFVPDLPVACLDEAIYGGGFDHDLFHQLLPVPPPEEDLHFEASLLVVESAAQAYNSLVLASHHDGPAYDGHATWPGAALFDRLAGAFGRSTIPELVAGYGMLGLVCHPDLPGDPATTWSQLLPPGHQAAALQSLIDDHARYVRLDAAWLRTLRPRYEAPILQRWRTPLADRIAPSHGAVIAALDDLLWALEDVDLRGHDCSLVGLATTRRQQGRWAWMRALELSHLLHKADAATPPALREALSNLADLDDAQRDHVAACVGLTGLAHSARDPEARATLAATGDDLDARVTEEVARVEAVADTLRGAQRVGTLSGPPIPGPFTGGYRELFAGSEYALPVHVGADDPTLSRAPDHGGATP